MMRISMLLFKKSLLLLLILAPLFSACDSPNSSDGISNTTENKLYVFSNTSQKFYLLDYETFEVVKEIPLSLPEGVYMLGLTLSTNRDYLFFRTDGPYPDPPLGFAIYDIENEKFLDRYITEFHHSGPVRFIAARDASAPGLIYAHLRDAGTYAIDLLEKQVKEVISKEYAFTLYKFIRFSPDGKWAIVYKKYSGDQSYSELELYDGTSGLHNLQFTLNQNNKDSISVYDFAFSEDNRSLYLSYQLSDGRSRNIESYFGSYNLENRKLYRSSLAFPWSLNPYYLDYSPTRNEVYLIGAYDIFYVIDTNTYQIKNTITLQGKVQGPSRILVHPDEKKVFVSCPDSNKIFVINLDNQAVIQTIKLDRPYFMYTP